MPRTQGRRSRLFLAPLLASAASADVTRLGCNAEGGTLGRNFFFADLVKQSTFGWVTSPTTQNVSVDAAGWPTQDFALLVYNEPGGYTYPAADLSGVYTVTAAGGCATSVTSVYPGATVLNSSCAGGDLLAFVEVSADGALVNGRIALAFAGTSRAAGGGGLAHVSFLQPGFPAGTSPETFVPAGVEQFRRCSLIRFLGWTLIGHTQWDDKTPPSTADWSQRAVVGQPSYTLGGWGILGSGAPWETAAALCNAVNASIWVNVPSGVDEAMHDDYVRRLVTLLDGLLAPGLQIFVEHANECFFGNNQCYQDDVAAANATVLQQGDPHRLNFGLESPPNATKNLLTWGSRYYSWSCLRIAQVAGTVVGPERVGRADHAGVRVVPVLGALGSYAKDLEDKASWLFAAWGPPAAQGLATVNIGAYVGSKVNKTNPGITTDLVMQGFFDAIAAATPASPTAYGSNALANFAAASAFWGLALHAYEGGPDTSGGAGCKYANTPHPPARPPRPPLTLDNPSWALGNFSRPSTAAALMALANATMDARMADVVFEIVQGWQSWGGGTFNFFIIGSQPAEQPWGSYSNLFDSRVPDTPKSRGLDRIVASAPAAVAAGWAVPVLNHSASFYVGYYSPSELPPASPVVTWLPPGTTLSYLVRLDAPCALGLNVTVYMSNFLKAGGDPLGVSVGVFLPAVNVTAPATGGEHGTFAPAAPALFPPLPAAALPNGLVTVRLSVVTPAAPQFSLRALDVTCRTS